MMNHPIILKVIEASELIKTDDDISVLIYACLGVIDTYFDDIKTDEHVLFYANHSYHIKRTLKSDEEDANDPQKTH